MEALIVHYDIIFDERLPAASYVSSSPLPLAHLGETASPHAYASIYTKFSEYGSQSESYTPLPQSPAPQAAGDGFIPQLPSRPPASIHPSWRGNTVSSSGHFNTSPILTEVEANLSSPILIGTKGLDFSPREISEGDWTGTSPASTPISDPASPSSLYVSTASASIDPKYGSGTTVQPP